MRTTARYTLFLGFSTASVAALAVIRFGTEFTTLTAVLYLYGIVCVAGGLIGHRHAYLRHAEGHEDPSLRHILGIDGLKAFLEDDLWLVELEQQAFEAETVSLTENLVSVERELDGRMTGVSYPRSELRSCNQVSASR